MVSLALKRCNRIDFLGDQPEGALGLAEMTAERLLADLARAVPSAAERLIAEIQAGMNEAVSASPDPEATGAYVDGEMRMLRAAQRMVLSEMTRRLLG